MSLKELNLKLSDDDRKGIREFQEDLNAEFECIYKTLEEGDANSVVDAHRIHKRLKVLMKRLTDEHVRRLDQGDRNVQAGVIYLDALAHLERMGDHLVNIAERSARVLKVTTASL